jgi:choline-sulfatase
MLPTRAAAVAALLTIPACSAPAPKPEDPRAQNLIVITIDTLRADRVGVYGYRAARTPNMDALAGRGARFDRAFAAAPITLTSHASLFTGRYPPGHGARDNGIRLDERVPTLAGALSAAGFETGAFVGAFPLDRRFGLARGFTTYGDRMPRGSNGSPGNERAGREVVDDALQWLQANRRQRYFLWVHLFEPHAPYGNPADAAQRARPASDRYDDEIAEADRQIGRLLDAVGPQRESTLVVVAADHGEAFGEHGEISHSIFVYDTTLRVPLIVAGPGVPARRVVSDDVSLVDVAPTVVRLLNAGSFDADGIDLRDALAGRPLPARDLYAESFAPRFNFGWSPLRAIRSGQWKFIDAPRPELYDVGADAGETRDLSAAEANRRIALAERVRRYSPAGDAARVDRDPASIARLQALGYTSGTRDAAASGVDPKDRREVAARMAQIASGELQGKPLEDALRAMLAAEPRNPQANLRLGYVLLESSRCDAAVRYFETAIRSGVAGAEAHLGLAACETALRRPADAVRVLNDAARLEPDNPVVQANLGIVLSDSGQPLQAIAPLERALAIDPDLHQARFNLAIAFARAGRRPESAAQATELLKRLPPTAPQRPEVERLLAAVR